MEGTAHVTAHNCECVAEYGFVDGVCVSCAQESYKSTTSNSMCTTFDERCIPILLDRSMRLNASCVHTTRMFTKEPASLAAPTLNLRRDLLCICDRCRRHLDSVVGFVECDITDIRRDVCVISVSNVVLFRGLVCHRGHKMGPGGTLLRDAGHSLNLVYDTFA